MAIKRVWNQWKCNEEQILRNNFSDNFVNVSTM